MCIWQSGGNYLVRFGLVWGSNHVGEKNMNIRPCFDRWGFGLHLFFEMCRNVFVGVWFRESKNTYEADKLFYSTPQKDHKVRTRCKMFSWPMGSQMCSQRDPQQTPICVKNNMQ